MSIEKLVDISVWVGCICGIISIISMIVTAVFKSNIAAWIAVITFIICVLSLLVEMGLVLWDMSNW